jgi:hypothetical protein
MERPESLSLSRLLSPPHSLAPTLKDAKAFPSSAPGWPFKTFQKGRYEYFDVMATCASRQSDVASTSRGCRRLQNVRGGRPTSRFQMSICWVGCSSEIRVVPAYTYMYAYTAGDNQNAEGPVSLQTKGIHTCFCLARGVWRLVPRHTAAPRAFLLERLVEALAVGWCAAKT